MSELVPGASLAQPEADSLIQLVQLAAGVDHEDDPAEHAIVQAIAQRVRWMSELEPELEPTDILPIPPLPDSDARAHWLAAIAGALRSPGVRELAYVLAFVVTVADLEMKPAERDAMDEVQRALGLDDRCAMDLIVRVTELVAAEAA